jgi:hypothetical protein
MASLRICVLLQVNITFPRMPCSWLSLDTMDVSGELHLDVVRLGEGMNSCGGWLWGCT